MNLEAYFSALGVDATPRHCSQIGVTFGADREALVHTEGLLSTSRVIRRVLERKDIVGYLHWLTRRRRDLSAGEA